VESSHAPGGHALVFPAGARDPRTMRKLALFALLVAVGIGAAAPARAQVAVDVRIGFPAPPPLVVVSPGVQVVPDYDEEVFFVNGWYWLRRDAVWYRTRDYRGGWIFVQPRMVPASIVRLPPGHYKHWRKDQEKAERKAWKQEAKAERKEWKEHDKAERKGHKWK
jgi:hypothetical protein